MTRMPEPTERELQILKVLWQRGQATVREVYEALPHDVPIVQNTVQAFLRIMEQKGLVTHRVDGRTFVYRPSQQRDLTSKTLLVSLLDSVFDGAVDQMVASALAVKQPGAEELSRLRALLHEHEAKSRRRKS